MKEIEEDTLYDYMLSFEEDNAGHENFLRNILNAGKKIKSMGYYPIYFIDENTNKLKVGYRR